MKMLINHFFSTISILALYGCVIPSSTLELRQLALRTLKAGILSTSSKILLLILIIMNIKSI